MVGVPGRSKGCNTCRIRKKGVCNDGPVYPTRMCDKATPSCSQCIRAGLACDGYGRDLVWVTSTSRTGATRNASSRCPAGNTAVAPWDVRYSKRISGQDQITLPDPLARTAREQLYVGRLCSASLPYGRRYSKQASDFTSNGWPRYIGSLYDTEETVRYITLAMSAAVLGVENRDSQLHLKGLQTYGRALQAMERAVGNAHHCVSDGLLAAARMMQLYELFFGNPEGWGGQVQGNLALFIARGPSAFKSEAGFQLFIDGRILAIMLSIGQRVKSPLSSHAWRTIPWINREKATKDKLIDVLCDITGLLEQVDVLAACKYPDQAEELRAQLLLDCRHAETALNIWKAQVGVKLRKFDYTTAPLPLSAPTTDTDFAILHLSSTYWIACLLLYSTMNSVLKPIPAKGEQEDHDYRSTCSPAAEDSTPKSLNNLNIYNPPMNPKIFANKIAHSTHLFFGNSAGFVQSASALFPLTIALSYFAMTERPGQSSEEAQMLYKLFHQPFMGTYIGRFLADLHNDVKIRQGEDVWTADTAQAREKIWLYEVIHKHQRRRRDGLGA